MNHEKVERRAVKVSCLLAGLLCASSLGAAAIQEASGKPADDPGGASARFLRKFSPPEGRGVTAAELGAAAPDYRAGSDFYQAEKYAEAAEAFRRANRAAGGSCEACLRSLSVSQVKSGQVDGAVETSRELVKVVDGKPKIAAAYANLGVVLSIRGAIPHLKRKDVPTPQSKDLLEAEEAYRKALDSGYPYRADLLATIASLRFWRGDNTGAVEVARQALELRPSEGSEETARMGLCAARLAGAIPARVKDAPGVEKAPGASGNATPPKKLFAPIPNYPETAKGSRREGVVQVETIIDEEGCILLPKITKSLDPALDRAAIEAVREWAFHPAEMDGKPVKVYYTLDLKFSATNPPEGRR